MASTKAFTSQLEVLVMMAMFLGRRKHLAPFQAREIIKDLQQVPEQVRHVLKLSDKIKEVAALYKDCPNWLYLGRGYNYPVALEGALKLKEISYVHAEGLPAAEMKHGPIALITEGMPVVFLANKGLQYEKVLSNMEEVRSRGGHIIAVATEGDKEIQSPGQARLLRAGRAGTVPAAPERRAAADAGLPRGRDARLRGR